MTKNSTPSSRITAISPQKKNPGRFSVFIENNYAFSLSASLSFTLHTGQCLSEEEIDALKKAGETELAVARGLFYLKFRPRSISETTGYLEKKQFTQPAIEAAIKKLKDYGYLDDAAFAQFWVESRKQHRPRGLFALRYELMQKGIDKRIIADALSQYDEFEQAWRAVSAKLSAWRKLTDFELKKKTYTFLKQKGFAFETCEDVFNKAIEERSHENK